MCYKLENKLMPHFSLAIPLTGMEEKVLRNLGLKSCQYVLFPLCWPSCRATEPLGQCLAADGHVVGLVK